MQKSSPQLIEAFKRAFPDDPRAEQRPMFGFPAGFVNGNHFGGLFEEEVVLRLSEADRRTLVEQHGAEQFAPMGRPMSGYVLAPRPIVEDPQQLRAWLIRALEYGASLPPKQAKAAAKVKSTKSAKGAKGAKTNAR
jgi:TfoX/Sxy family transcriptional regulator of competence genes